MPDPEAVVVRDGGRADADRIRALRRVVFGTMEADRLDPRHGSWQYEDAVDGAARIDVAEAHAELLGHFAHVPRRFVVGDGVRTGSLAMDLMVHPAHRRTGIMVRMAGRAADRGRAGGVDFMFAFPIRMPTVRGFKRLGWLTVADLPVLAYPLRFGRIASRLVPFAPAAAIAGGLGRLAHAMLGGAHRPGTARGACEEVGELDAHWTTFHERLARAAASRPRPHASGDRRPEYVAWRYRAHPTRSYSLLRTMRPAGMTGFMALRTTDLLGFECTVITDLATLDDDSALDLIAAALERGRAAGSDLVAFMTPRTHRHHRLARGAGFVATPRRFRLMVLPLAAGFDPGAIDWHVHWGDTDVM